MSTLASAIQRGTRGAQPAASAVSIGTLYCVTDESNLVERSTGAAWQSYSASGAGSGTVTNTGTLTATKAIIGNGTADVTVSAATGVAHLASGVLTGSNVLLASEVTGDLPFANLTQIAGLSVLGVTGSSTADVAAITAGTDGHVLTRVSSSSVAFAAPATWDSATQGASADTSMSADTITDVTGASLSLVAGTWQLSATVTINCNTVAYMLIKITTAANAVLNGTQGITNNGVAFLTTAPYTVVVGSTTTYKVRVQSGSAAAVALRYAATTSDPVTYLTATRVK